MSFDLTIPRLDGNLELSLDVGESLFVLGANGTGKSSLMHQFYRAQGENARRISAHRQTWFSSNTINMTPQGRRSTEHSILRRDRQPNSRWTESNAEERANMAIYDLVDAENVRARSIASAVDSNDMTLARLLSRDDAPIKIINELLQLSNLPVEISIEQPDQIVAKKYGGTPYSVAELSDGERNALLIAASVLTANAETLVLIDEPERHLHRSIISPLLTQLFARRPDCAFIVSTHEVMLPIDNPDALTLLVRGCTFVDQTVSTWDVDLLSPEADINDDLKRDILGARSKILFVEGTERSLDKPLYNLLFPNVSVIAKSSCRDVEHAVSGIRDASDLHWIHAFGIVDNDRRTPADLERLEGKGVYAVSVFSVESLYYHPEIQHRVLARHATVTGEDVPARLNKAQSAAIAAIEPHIQRLSERTAEKVIRERFMQHIPQRNDIVAGISINVSIEVNTEVTDERERFQKLIDAGDLTAIIEQYPIRETPALDKIVENLGFQDKKQYEGTVRKLLADDADARTFVKSLFGTLPEDLESV